MLKRTALVLLIGWSPLAMAAEQVRPTPPSQPDQERALQMMYQRELASHQADLAAALAIQEQLAQAKQQIDDLKKSPAHETPTAPP